MCCIFCNNKEESYKQYNSAIEFWNCWKQVAVGARLCFNFQKFSHFGFRIFSSGIPMNDIFLIKKNKTIIWNIRKIHLLEMFAFNSLSPLSIPLFSFQILKDCPDCLQSRTDHKLDNFFLHFLWCRNYNKKKIINTDYWVNVPHFLDNSPSLIHVYLLFIQNYSDYTVYSTRMYTFSVCICAKTFHS